MKGATFASDNFEGTLEAIQITLGTYILPYIEQFYTYVNELASSFLTLFDDPEYIKSALASGAHGYVLKQEPAAEILKAISKVMQGEKYLSPGLNLSQ